MAVYTSTDGGQTWQGPQVIHESDTDDKQAIASDLTPTSPFFGHVYAVWDDGSALAFARTVDHGATWQGIAGQPAGTALGAVADSFSPEVIVAPSGAVYVAWTSNIDHQINLLTSTDGGASFSDPVAVAMGLTYLEPPQLARPGDFPELPGGSFRVGTAVALCTGRNGSVVVAWSDYRDDVARIYFRSSADGGATWQGPPSGQPLLGGSLSSGGDQHEFNPQLVTMPSGEIGCAFYLFGPKGDARSLIDVELAVSTDDGATFSQRVTVTESPWDPAVDAPLSHGDPHTTFIGDYFGLGASDLGFFPFWTDTRTGVQEIFTTQVAVRPQEPPSR
jgi:hypothetical protein